MDFHHELSRSRCFVFGFALDGKGGAAALPADGSAERAQWIHLDYSEPDCARILQLAGVPDSAIDTLTRPDTRPRTLNVNGGRILLLRTINQNPGDEPEDMISLRLWWEPGRLISVRQRRIHATQELKTELEAGRGPDNLENLLFALIERTADSVSDYVDGLEEDIERFESAVDSGSPGDLRRQVSELRRHAATVRRFLAPQRDALESFSRLVRDFVDAQYALYLHEQADRFLRYVEDLDLVREKALLLQEELMNRIAQEQNARMYVLSVVAVIFLPISFVTGMFGMNLGGMPGTEHPLGFLTVSLGLLGIAAGILAWFRFRRWL